MQLLLHTSLSPVLSLQTTAGDFACYGGDCVPPSGVVHSAFRNHTRIQGTTLQRATEGARFQWLPFNSAAGQHP